MRPVEFSPEAIIQAGVDLQAENRNVTGFALRQKVGGGNPGRLKQVWDEYLASAAVTKSEPVAELPLEVAEEVISVARALSERIGVLAVELNDKAVKASERRVAEVMRAVGEQREQAERELADAAHTVDDLESRLDAVQSESEGLALRLAESHSASQVLAVELAQLRERLLAAGVAANSAGEQHAAEITQQRQHIARLQDETEQQHGELATIKARAEVSQAYDEQQQRRAQEESERAAQRVSRAESERDEARKEAGVAREEAARLGGQVDALQAQQTALLAVLKPAATGALPQSARAKKSQ